MNLSQQDLWLIAEALQARIETGEFSLARSRKGKIIICSPSHLKALNDLLDRVVANPEAYD